MAVATGGVRMRMQTKAEMRRGQADAGAGAGRALERRREETIPLFGRKTRKV